MSISEVASQDGPDPAAGSYVARAMASITPYL